MKNKILIFVSLLSIMGFSLKAQLLKPTVVSSAGSVYKNSTGIISFTVAEMSMIYTLWGPVNSNFILTHGFQQPEEFFVSVPEKTAQKDKAIIYPNPTSGKFSIKYSAVKSCETVFQLYNLVGQIVYTKSISQIKGQNNIQLDISKFSKGMYFLELKEANTSGNNKSNFYKINLVK